MTTEKQSISRRRFLQLIAAGAASAPHVIPASALGRDGAKAPSERVTLGFIGVARRGLPLLRGFMSCKGAQPVALCDCFKSRRERLAKLAGSKAYADFREVLAREDIDAVVVATPIHWHVPIANAAARAGKDAYVEKPLGLTVEQDLACRKVFHDTGRVFQYGTQQRSTRHFWVGCELVRSGRIGQVHRIEVVAPDGPVGGSTNPMPVPPDLNYEMWLGPGPETPYLSDLVKPPGHECVTGFGIGWLAAWGAHPLDIMIWGSDADLAGPMEFEGTGVVPEEGLFDTVVHWDVKIKMGNGFTVTLKPGPDSTKFIGTEGWVRVGRGSGIEAHPKSLLDVEIEPETASLFRSERHDQNFINAVKARKRAVTTVAEAVRSDIISQMSNIAIRLGRKVLWDPKKEKIVGDPQAEKMMHRDLRGSWTL